MLSEHTSDRNALLWFHYGKTDCDYYSVAYNNHQNVSFIPNY